MCEIRDDICDTAAISAIYLSSSHTCCLQQLIYKSFATSPSYNSTRMQPVVHKSLALSQELAPSKSSGDRYQRVTTDL